MNCGGDGEVADGVECPICEGTGEVECETCAEPDGDYAYEQYRDRQMEERE
jgi:RecJ-like exonuclease